MNTTTLFNYNTELLELLSSIPAEPQGAVGDSPASWAQEMGLTDLAHYSLPNEALTRQQVREICRNDPPLKGYLCAMAWGAQGRGPSGSKSVKEAWKNRAAIEANIKSLQSGTISRAQAFDLFCGENKIGGLGPAYFTKILYFFSPENPSNCYIMDQWTTKPVLLLTEQHIIRHLSGSPSSSNTGKNYELFCKVIEDLSVKLGVSTGQEMEERLFSVGSIRRQPRGKWRQIVYDRWSQGHNLARYTEKLVANIFKEIS